MRGHGTRTDGRFVVVSVGLGFARHLFAHGHLVRQLEGLAQGEENVGGLVLEKES